MFVLLQQAGLKNTHIGLILTHTSFALPLVVWMMHSFFAELPRKSRKPRSSTAPAAG